MDLNRAAESSPTAAALLGQINAELKQADDVKRQEELDAANAARQARLAHITSCNDACRDALARYDAARQQANEALLAAFHANAQIPSGVTPANALGHLQRVHLPPAVLAPLDPLYPPFSSMQALLMSRGLG